MVAALQPVDGASGAAFRAAFGLIAMVSALRFFFHGWISALYIEPAHHFTYLGFGWVQPWPGWGMYAHFAALALLGVLITVGYRYRLSIALYFVGFTYVELLDQTTYLNHYYFISLTALLMCFMPLHRTWSVDAARGRAAGTIPRGVIWLLRGQLAVVYIFAGIAKLNPDWLLHAEPLRFWLSHETRLPVVGGLLAEPAVAHLMSWGAVLFELTIVGWFLWRRSRPWAYTIVVLFHVLTAILFPVIGLFPWVMIAVTPIFFDTSWPRRWSGRWSGRFVRHARNEAQRDPALDRAGAPTPGRWPTRLIALGVLAYVAVQIAVPLRHLAYPGNVRWNEEGYRLSWRVMLTEKAGSVEFRVTDPATGRRWLVRPDGYYTDMQVRAMSTQPDMILQAAHLVADDFAERGLDVEVRADVFVSINGERAARLIDPEVDLATVARHPGPNAWVLPSPTVD